MTRELPKTILLAVALVAMAGSACARLPEAAAASVGQAAAAEAEPPQKVAMAVHKSPYCGCCDAWVEHMRQSGFQVEVRNRTDLHAVKQQGGVPAGKGSCHTAQVGGYFIEGHVPAPDVRRLLAERPRAKGLVVPGMPKGSPGMEVPGGAVESYTVELVAADGSTTPFAQH